MKWPLVWRSTLEKVELERRIWKAASDADSDTSSKLLSERNELEAKLEARSNRALLAERCLAETLERVAELNAEVARLTPKMDAVRERSRLTTAIRDQARQPDGTIDRRLVSHFRGQANTLRREGKTVDEIIDSIGEWQTTEDRDKPTIDGIVAAFNDTRL